MKRNIKAWVLAGVVLGLQGATFGSVINLPLRFWTGQGVKNEYGQLLPGTPAAPGALVQILHAENGVYPPDINGNPHASNAVVCVLYIGQGADLGLPATGLAHGNAMSNRFQAVKLVARYFNRGSAAESSFYTDSQVFTNSTTEYSAFTALASQTTTPLDAGDSDGDGLNNSWEKSLGSDARDPDTDKDGVSDLLEQRAGTDLTDPSSYLAMVEVVPQAGGMTVQWDSVAGRSYQLQMSTNDLTAGAQHFRDVGDAVSATGDVSFVTLTNVTSESRGQIRVRLVE